MRNRISSSFERKLIIGFLLVVAGTTPAGVLDAQKASSLNRERALRSQAVARLTAVFSKLPEPRKHADEAFSLVLVGLKAKDSDINSDADAVIKEASGYGLLTVKTSPTGASIAVGQEVWPEKTDAQRMVPAGNHTVTLAKVGYETVRAPVEVKAASQTTLQRTLTAVKSAK